METRRPKPVEIGRLGEEAAVRHLLRKGYTIVERGYRLFRGEIDIVAFDGPTLVFVEVKTRTSDDRGTPEEAVTPAKRRQVRRIALGFLAEHADLAASPCRFDVLAVEFDADGRPEVRQIEDAF